MNNRLSARSQSKPSPSRARAVAALIALALAAVPGAASAIFFLPLLALEDVWRLVKAKTLPP